MTWAGAIASPTPGMAILHGYWFHFRYGIHWVLPPSSVVTPLQALG